MSWTTEKPAKAGLYYAEDHAGDTGWLTAEEREGKWGAVLLRYHDSLQTAHDEWERFLLIPDPTELAALMQLAEAAREYAKSGDFNQTPNDSQSDSSTETQNDARRAREEFLKIAREFAQRTKD
jgi:hypothetical protein